MKLYHGSHIIVETPAYGVGNPRNDYGLGFYCTESLELAKEWACPTPEDGFANEYSLDIGGLSLLDLSEERWHILNWLAVLLENRTFDISSQLAKDTREYIISTFLPPYRGSDIIIGYRADDSYFSFARAFLNGGIPLDALTEAMRLGKLGLQYCIRSRRAFEGLHFAGAVPADGQEYYIRRSTRDIKAREDYLRLLSQRGSATDGIYAIDILRQKWKNDDKRLR